MPFLGREMENPSSGREPNPVASYRPDGLPISSISMVVSVAIAVSIVGLRSGQNLEECSDGSGVPLAFASLYFVGSTAPTKNITEGTPARPYSEKSSETILDGTSTTFASPSLRRRAAAMPSVSAGSL